MPANFVKVTRAWSKTLGAAAAGATPPVTGDVAFQFSNDPLYQIFKQLNAVIADNQNVILSSPLLTAGATLVPTNSAFRAIVGGVYQLLGALTFPPLPGPAITTGNFGLYWFTVDNLGNPHSYASPGNNSATRAALTYPNPLPSANEAVVGMIEVAPAGTTFTPGTTNLNAANVNATVLSIIGDTGFTAFGLQELQIS